MFALGILFALLIVVIVIAKVPFIHLVRGLRPILFLILLTVIIQIFVTKGEPIVEFWGISISKEGLLYAGIHQSVLGEIGFRVDTRVYGVAVASLAEFGRWFTTAQAADELTGAGSLEGSHAETGGAWRVVKGNFLRTGEGVVPSETEALAFLETDRPSGLLHVVVEGGRGKRPAGLVWEARGAENFRCVLLGKKGCDLFRVRDGEWKLEARNRRARPRCLGAASLQVAAGGGEIVVRVDGKPALAVEVEDVPEAEGTWVGLYARPGGRRIRFRRFEAHPTEIEIPHELHVGDPWIPPRSHPAVTDDFDGPPGELSGRETTTGEAVWEKTLGAGRFLVTGSGKVKVDASTERPNPGRTAYTFEWRDPAFVELEATIRPPGSGRGQGEKGRGGFIIQQDPDNYIVINTYLDDWRVGKSISTFYHLQGEEDTYRAVWTNVGDRIHWGKAYTLCAAFDGMNLQVYLNGEAILYRALTDVYPGTPPLRIDRVGIVANWEFGDDTGSEFLSFAARAR